MEASQLRNYWRQRKSLVESCSRQILLMQKSLEQMNVQLHKVVSDITGVTGMSIVRAIVGGEHDAQRLSHLRKTAVRCDEATLEKALTGNYREEHVFGLKMAVDAYDFYQLKLRECGVQLELYYEQQYQHRVIKNLKRRAEELGLQLVPSQTVTA